MHKLLARDKEHCWLIKPVILAPKHVTVDGVNNHLLEQLPGDRWTYKTIYTRLYINETVHYLFEFLNSLVFSDLPPNELHLKVWAPIMLLKNFNSPISCNGMSLIIKTLLKTALEATILTEKASDKDVFTPKIPLFPFNTDWFQKATIPIELKLYNAHQQSTGSDIGGYMP